MAISTPLSPMKYYQSGNKYNWTHDEDFINWPGGRELYNEAPEAGYVHTLGQKNLTGFDPNSNTALRLYDKLRLGYGASLLDDPSMDWFQYMKDVDFDNMIGSMGPQERGIDQRAYKGNDRWLRR